MGVGGAAVMPSTLSIISNVFDPRERGRAIGVWAGSVGLAVAVGPLVGGFLPEPFWWGSVFLTGVPVMLVLLVAGPLLRWRTTHYVITTHRLLHRTGILSRTGRDIGLSRITDVSYRQTLWERVINSGTLTVETAGEGGATVFSAIPDSVGVQQLLNQLVEEDADRRARESAGYFGRYSWEDPEPLC
jgi:uncharacterized membrane protein YdbT with pleckstrin-like domain